MIQLPDLWVSFELKSYGGLKKIQNFRIRPAKFSVDPFILLKISDQTGGPWIPAFSFKNLDRFGRSWVLVSPFKNLDQIGGPWIPSSTFKNFD